MIDFCKPSISDKEINAVTQVLKSGWLTTGQKNADFASMINDYIGSKYCILVNSCTAALHLSLICAGVGPGDEVITTPLTFAATANAILYVGAKPVFVDIKPNDLIIDESKIEAKITKKTKAIIPVHYAGYSANLKKLRTLCRKYNLALIEDAAHSFGSKFNGEFIGSKSEYCCFSFYPTKNITTVEGGALVTNDKKIYERASVLALHGIDHDAWKRYTKEGTWQYGLGQLGFKYNLPDINCALGIEQLKRINFLQKKREGIDSYYRKHLKDIPEIELYEGNEYSHPFKHLFVIKIKSKKISRDQFIRKMKEKDIICSVHFIPLTHFELYKPMVSKKESFPITDEVFSQCVSLPFGPSLTQVDIKTVVAQIKRIFPS
jgi:dTDP-4-amino-4,6-dideoxygalactose transaminase